MTAFPDPHDPAASRDRSSAWTLLLQVLDNRQRTVNAAVLLLAMSVPAILVGVAAIVILGPAIVASVGFGSVTVSFLGLRFRRRRITRR
jgi:hypothetical protein